MDSFLNRSRVMRNPSAVSYYNWSYLLLVRYTSMKVKQRRSSAGCTCCCFFSQSAELILLSLVRLFSFHLSKKSKTKQTKKRFLTISVDGRFFLMCWLCDKPYTPESCSIPLVPNWEQYASLNMSDILHVFIDTTFIFIAKIIEVYRIYLFWVLMALLFQSPIFQHTCLTNHSCRAPWITCN